MIDQKLFDLIEILMVFHLYNFRQKQRTPYPDLVMPLLAKATGILMQHKENKELTLHFLSRRQHYRILSTETIQPIYPTSNYLFFVNKTLAN